MQTHNLGGDRSQEHRVCMVQDDERCANMLWHVHTHDTTQCHMVAAHLPHPPLLTTITLGHLSQKKNAFWGWNLGQRACDCTHW